MWFEVQKWFKCWQKRIFHHFQHENAKTCFENSQILEQLEWVQSQCPNSSPMLWIILRNPNLCNLRFRSDSSINKREIFMIFSAKTQKSTLCIREGQNNLNECKVNVSFHHLCYEEHLETTTCLIWGAKMVLALTKEEF